MILEVDGAVVGVRLVLRDALVGSASGQFGMCLDDDAVVDDGVVSGGLQHAVLEDGSSPDDVVGLPFAGLAAGVVGGRRLCHGAL